MTPEVKRTSLSPARPVFPFCRLSSSRASYPPSILSSASPLPGAMVALSRQRRASRTSPCAQPSFFQFRELFFQYEILFGKHDTCQRRGRLLALRLKGYWWGAFRREGVRSMLGGYELLSETETNGLSADPGMNYPYICVNGECCIL